MFHLSQIIFQDVLQIIDQVADPGTVFDKFNAIPNEIDLWKAQTFNQYVAGLSGNQRGLFHTISLEEFTVDILNQLVNQTTSIGSVKGHSATIISFDVEPFVKSYGLQAKKK